MKRLAFIDLEGTLTEKNSWSYIMNKFGAEEFLEKFQKLFSEGKIGYEEWRRKLSEAWKNSKTTKKQFLAEIKEYKLNPGAKELILGLKDKGFKIIIITGGPDIFAELVSEELNFDESYSANEFLFDEKGFFQDIKTRENYRRGQGKVEFIKEIIKKEKTNKDHCIAIGGDDINDLWMLKELKSFAVKPHLNQIKQVVDYEVDNLIEILDCV